MYTLLTMPIAPAKITNGRKTPYDLYISQVPPINVLFSFNQCFLLSSMEKFFNSPNLCFQFSSKIKSVAQFNVPWFRSASLKSVWIWYYKLKCTTSFFFSSLHNKFFLFDYGNFMISILFNDITIIPMARYDLISAHTNTHILTQHEKNGEIVN